MPLTPEQEASLNELVDGTANANTNLDGILKWTRRGAVLLLLAILAVGFYAYQGQQTADRAQRAAARAEAARARSEANTVVARRFSCLAFNSDRRQVITGLGDVFSVSNDDFVTALISIDGDPTPAERAAADAFNLNHNTVVTNRLTTVLKRRDCSDAGIAEYLGQTARQP